MGEDPIEIAIFYLFVVLVLAQVKCLEVEPAQLNRVLQAYQAIQQLRIKEWVLCTYTYNLRTQHRGKALALRP